MQLFVPVTGGSSKRRLYSPKYGRGGGGGWGWGGDKIHCFSTVLTLI